MRVGEELKHFRATVEEVREDKPFMHRIGVTAAIVAIVMLTITAHTLAFNDELAKYPDMQAERFSSLVVACMNGRSLRWQDPHTGAWMVAFCDVHLIHDNEYSR